MNVERKFNPGDRVESKRFAMPGTIVNCYWSDLFDCYRYEVHHDCDPPGTQGNYAQDELKRINNQIIVEES